MNILIFGPPGSGKGTQSQKVSSYFDLKHISFGEVLRGHVEKKTDIGIKVQNIINKGGLVGEHLMHEILLNQMENFVLEKKRQRGIIFDGFPRNIDQSKLLDEVLNQYKKKLHGVFHLSISFECAIERIKNRSKVEDRKDDQDLEKVKNRINVYKNETKPVLDFYNNSSVPVFEINGERSLEDIFDDIKQKIDGF